jgi:hypothetical protein
MAKAKDSLSNGDAAIKVLARLAAKKAVQDELREQGVRVSLIRPAELSAKAQAYLAANPQLIDEAKERARQMYERKWLAK